MKVEIILQRHGESLGNVQKMYLGSTDLDLSERGFEQARDAADALMPKKLDAIYSSDLKRAYNTALAHAKLRDMQVVPEPQMRELYIGDWEGLTIYEIMEKYGEMFTVDWQQHFGTFVAPRGESVPALAERIYKAVYSLAVQHKDGAVLLIATHAAAIRAFYGKISGIEPDRLAKTLPFPANASFTRVIFDGERLLPVSYSQEK